MATTGSVGGDPNIGSPSAAEVNAAAQTWQQGDVFIGTGAPLLRLRLPTAGADGSRRVVAEQHDQIVIVSQTCDVVRSIDHRPYVTVAPAIELDGEDLVNAQRRRIPRYVAVPGCGATTFADLDSVATFDKAVMFGRFDVHGCDTEAELRSFGRGCARHFGRYAFPNEFNAAVQKLAQRLNKRAGKATPEGRCVDQVQEIRVAAPGGWHSPLLVFFIEPESMPPADESIPTVLTGEANSIDDLCTRLDTEHDPAVRCALWEALINAWVGLCEPNDVVAEISGLSVTMNSINAAVYEASDPLDLDYLSTSS